MSTDGKKRSFQLALLAVTAGLLIVSLIGGEFFVDQVGQHSPTVLALLILMFVARRETLSNLSMLSIVAFIWLHILGARYAYSSVPYDEWAMTIFGCTVSDKFHFHRNHYDRVVHFAYGLLATPPQVELLQRRLRLSAFGTHLISIAVVVCIGSLYEIFEWGLAELCAPDFADRYNGQQGDLWDAQKDMLLNFLGAVAASSAILLNYRVQQRIRNQESTTPDRDRLQSDINQS